VSTNQPGSLDVSTDLLLVANNATTTLNGNITAVATSVVVLDGTVFPASDFYLSIGGEILFCSSRTGNNLTVVRAQQGTSGATAVTGAAAVGNVTAGHHETLRDALIATQEGAMRRPSVHDGPLGIVRFPDDPLTNIRRFT